MPRYPKYLGICAAVALASLLFWLYPARSRVSRSNKLAVVFVGMTNAPTRTMGPPRVEVCGGATGLCALFLVTNTTAKEFLWFKTPFGEQKIGATWQSLNPGTNGWSGVEGSIWSPHYGCLMAVGWPPGLPTNACWRLQVTYGSDPSVLEMFINEKSGREFFHSSKAENTVPSSDVSQ